MLSCLVSLVHGVGEIDASDGDASRGEVEADVAEEQLSSGSTTFSPLRYFLLISYPLYPPPCLMATLFSYSITHICKRGGD